jgi:hypothetical protein
MIYLHFSVEKKVKELFRVLTDGNRTVSWNKIDSRRET